MPERFGHQPEESKPLSAHERVEDEIKVLRESGKSNEEIIEVLARRYEEALLEEANLRDKKTVQEIKRAQGEHLREHNLNQSMRNRDQDKRKIPGVGQEFDLQ